MKRHAFTLIELLVVIAIIAILAAILFPVFAQAKSAAKKTSSLSNVKQLNTGTQIYLSDYDDTFPLAYGKVPGGGWAWNAWLEVPQNWSTYSASLTAYSSGSWHNEIDPYVKNRQIAESPDGIKLNIAFYSTLLPGKVKEPGITGYGYNGMLHGYNATAVTSPVTTPLATQVGGKDNVVGFDTGPFPALYCGVTSDPSCQYRPTASGCSGYGNGTYSYWFGPYNTQWMYGNTQTWSYVDGHAKAVKLGMNYGPGTRTDYRNDPFANYLKADGRANYLYSWYDEYYCHALMFRPDWDGQTITGTPYAAY
ncbi:MAG: prepilin-type N-terminal cleavage/methylation domain-containing protein [Armatimonadetes bacterium]|nr:prepilin-type N-terminal cleavage/methylation domain-containing protein [Armatimonadota bacterium]MBS1712559.1 prepilin-type N-terminal cleavage/methylation domain-containing protein [Armatimonadota bacterium]MBX3109132.1 prepilin-type N-terminal cleavage/methylation domain-containing protein [Fimbriimonadaceae bacterium]